MSKIVMLMIQGVGPIVGEEVDTPNSQNSITLKRPVMVGIVPGPRPQDKGQLGFNPYLEFTTEFDSGIEFRWENILHMLTPLTQVENAYRANYTESGLVLPPQGGLHRV